MRILYLELRNFGNIFTGMGRKSIKIDFSKSKNQLVLLVGENGTGKTSILSELHPFAYPGNMDVRNSTSIILEGEDGYKEIQYTHEDNIYVIKHHYQFKTTKGVKSFISKNGQEMNPNGNVSSFKEALKLELFIEQDHLKLLRLGSNVNSFIKMKATERKNFTSELLKDIDAYSKFYKKINDDSRLLKTIIKSVSDKMEKLKIFDEKEEIQHLEFLQSKLKTGKDFYDKLTSELGKINGSLNVLIPDGIASFKSEIRDTKFESKDILDSIETKRNKLVKSDIDPSVNFDKKIQSLEKKLYQDLNKITSNNSMIDFFFNQLNNYFTQKEEKENNLKYISSELEYSNIVELYLQLTSKKEKLDIRFDKFNPVCTKEEMMSVLSLLHEIGKIIAEIHEFDNKAVKQVVDHLLNGDNVDSLVRQEVSTIDNEMSRSNTQISQMSGANAKLQSNVYVLYKPPTCDCDCPFQKFYKDVTGVEEESEKMKLKNNLESLDKKRDYFISFLDIEKKIDFILLLIKTNKTLIEKMPENFFDIKNILDSIKKSTVFYNEDYITNYVSMLEDYEDYKDLDKRIKDVYKEKTFIEKNSNSVVSVQKELETIDIEIDKLETDLNKLKNENEELRQSSDKTDQSLKTLQAMKELIEDLQKLEDRKKDITSKLIDMNNIQNKVDSSLEELKDLESQRYSINKENLDSETKINNISFRLREFNALTEERKILTEKFDDITIIKEALSSNKGIPLLFVQLYLKNTKIMVNQLLDSIYDGELQIDEFIINEKEFNIPYLKRGMRIDDVIHCSQGEQSFISMALSFALIEQSLEGYNIMLLDEIDTALSIKYRSLFISILEQQLKTIKSEQTFLITHNNMFDNYPVDIIMTSDVSIDNYKNTNIIFKA